MLHNIFICFLYIFINFAESNINAMAGLYVHIPICRHKCLYCDFYSCGEKAVDADALIACICEEMRRRRKELYDDRNLFQDFSRPLFDTVYIGGGTPSLLTENQLRKLLREIYAIFNIKEGAEVTIEVNPDDVTADLCAVLKECGVNRISAGIQSLVDKELLAVGRRHNADTARRAMGLLSEHFDNCSFDLIFGLPGQTFQSWKYSVDEVMAYRPKHISCYSLMYEEGTALTLLRDQGRIKESDEILSEKMFGYIQRAASDHNYIQYEISNYAQPGFESRHNSSYWCGAPYLGIGPGAHSYDGDRKRRANTPDSRKYIKHFSSVEDKPFYEEEILSDAELKEEYLLTRLRMRKGFSREDYVAHFGGIDDIAPRLNRLLSEGLLIEEGGYIKIAPEHIMMSDAIIVELF